MQLGRSGIIYISVLESRLLNGGFELWRITIENAESSLKQKFLTVTIEFSYVKIESLLCQKDCASLRGLEVSQ
jgi:hypothetical protein